jgi:hypothetical protein
MEGQSEGRPFAIVREIFLERFVNIICKWYNFIRQKEITDCRKEGDTIEEIPPCNNQNLGSSIEPVPSSPGKTLEKDVIKYQ